jgi:nitrite reductase/ring-hydroxylating ferredoxin subunit
MLGDTTRVPIAAARLPRPAWNFGDDGPGVIQLTVDVFRTVGPSDAIHNGFAFPTTWTTSTTDLGRARRRSLYAFDDLCTCAEQACPLSGGLLTGTTLMCQCHGSRFDITNGAVINRSATEALNVYEVQDVEGSIHIRA